MIISFLNKGGAGKTTLATNLGVCFKSRGKSVLLVDADPQASARDWHMASEGSMLDVIGFDRPTIEKDIRPHKHNYDLIFVDSGKFDVSEKILQMAVKIILLSDVVLIPVTPSPYDVWAAKPVVDLIKQRQEITDGKLKSAFVISRQIGNTRIGKEVRTVLEDYQLPVFYHGTGQRVAYSETAAHGRTVLQSNDEWARNEINGIAEELMEFCGMPAPAINNEFGKFYDTYDPKN